MAKTNNEPDLEEDDVPRESTLQRLENVGGYSTVFQSGQSPCFILKEASTAPRVVSLRGGTVQSLTGFHTAVCDRGFAYLDAEVSQEFGFMACVDANRELAIGSDMSVATTMSVRRHWLGDTQSKFARRGSSNVLLRAERSLCSGYK